MPLSEHPEIPRRLASVARRVEADELEAVIESGDLKPLDRFLLAATYGLEEAPRVRARLEEGLDEPPADRQYGIRPGKRAGGNEGQRSKGAA